MIPAPGSASSRNIFSTRMAPRSASRPGAAFPLRKVNTTPPSATRTSAASPARLWTRTSTSASTPASTTKASIPKSPRASGNSRSSAKARKNAADQVWVARYLLMRLCEKYGVDVNWHCKPLGKDVDWNGSGMHTNFSTEYLREVGGKEYFEKLMAAFDKYKNEHIAVYGPDNHLRLTGLHETQSIDKFNYGVANRGASVRAAPKLHSQRLPRLSGRPPSELAGRPLQDCRPHPADHCDHPDQESLQEVSFKTTSGGTGETARAKSTRRFCFRQNGFAIRGFFGQSFKSGLVVCQAVDLLQLRRQFFAQCRGFGDLDVFRRCVSPGHRETKRRAFPPGCR